MRGDYARAAVQHLIALRGKPDDGALEYELACDFALWEQHTLAMQYLQAAADHGYWGYPVIADDLDLQSLKTDPAFPAIVLRIKNSYATESPKHTPGMTVKTPVGAMPAAALLASHPDDYAGAICNSPGPYSLVPTRLANAVHTGVVVLSVGSRETVDINKGVDAIESLWKAARRPVHVIHFEGGHQLPPDSEAMFRTALDQLSAGR